MLRNVVFISVLPNDTLTSVKCILVSVAKHDSSRRGWRPFGSSAHTSILNSTFVSNSLCLEEKLNLDGSASLALFYISCRNVVPHLSSSSAQLAAAISSPAPTLPIPTREDGAENNGKNASSKADQQDQRQKIQPWKKENILKQG